MVLLFARVELAKQVDVIEDPKRSAGGGNNQIVVTQTDIQDRSDRQIQLERLPCFSTIDGEIHSGFRTCIKQVGFLLVLTNDSGEGPVGNPRVDCLPCFSVVLGLV